MCSHKGACRRRNRCEEGHQDIGCFMHLKCLLHTQLEILECQKVQEGVQAREINLGVISLEKIFEVMGPVEIALGVLRTKPWG